MMTFLELPRDWIISRDAFHAWVVRLVVSARYLRGPAAAPMFPSDSMRLMYRGLSSAGVRITQDQAYGAAHVPILYGPAGRIDPNDFYKLPADQPRRVIDDVDLPNIRKIRWI